MRCILAIDPASVGALAWQHGDRVATLPFRVPAGEHLGERWDHMRSLVFQRCNGLRPDLVVYEVASFFRGGGPAIASLGYRAAIELACYQARICCLPVDVSVWRAWAVPKESRPQGAGKNGQLTSVQWKALTAATGQRFGAPTGLTVDEYEAVCILRWAQAHAEFGGG